MPVIKRHENILDFAVLQFGTVESLFMIAQQQGAGITDDLIPGTEIPVLATDVKAFKNAVQKISLPVLVVPNTKELQKHQNYADFVCQHAGTMEYIFEMAMLNGISITKQAVRGEMLEVKAVDEKVVQDYLASGLVISSEEDDPSDFIGVPPGGIGYMEIERTFIVS